MAEVDEDDDEEVITQCVDRRNMLRLLLFSLYNFDLAGRALGCPRSNNAASGGGGAREGEGGGRCCSCCPEAVFVFRKRFTSGGR